MLSEVFTLQQRQQKARFRPAEISNHLVPVPITIGTAQIYRDSTREMILL